MKVVNRSLDSLELMVAERPPDVSKIRALIGSVRNEFSRLSASQQELIESNVALAKRCLELEDAAKSQ